MLQTFLQRLPRRYQLASRALQLPPAGSNMLLRPATELALVLEHARIAIANRESPNAVLKRRFVNALAQLIRDALDSSERDFTFKAEVLAHREPAVREYVQLLEEAGHDARRIRKRVDAIAHPGKLRHQPSGPLKDALTQLHACSTSESWSALASTAARLAAGIPTAGAAGMNGDPAALNERHACLLQSLQKLHAQPALARLRRLDLLASQESVREYCGLRQRQGPLSGSASAAASGAAARQKGQAVEVLAAQAIQSLARRLNAATADDCLWRVATSLRAPAALAAGFNHAKTEWDAVLLCSGGEEGGRRSHIANGVGVQRETLMIWRPRLFIEAKASADAASIDYPTLMRGLCVLSQAQPKENYRFASREGSLIVSGESLSGLPKNENDAAGYVLYCTSAPAEAPACLLSAAARSRLLSAPASVEYATQLAVDLPLQYSLLEGLWEQILHAPQWRTVLEQGRALRRARELMVHTRDLISFLP